MPNRENSTRKTFEAELPQGYKEIFTVDAQNKKVIIQLNIAAVVISVLVIAVSAVIIKPNDFVAEYSLVRNICFLAAMLAYIVLHELVHGIAYRLLTKQKLTFGMTLSVAYCGVPNIYVYRKTALIALLAPFIVFIPVFGIPVFLLENSWDKFYVAVLLALHIGGCVGDLYDTFLYLFKFRSPDTLMNDTGPKQTFYVKK